MVKQKGNRGNRGGSATRRDDDERGQRTQGKGDRARQGEGRDEGRSGSRSGGGEGSRSGGAKRSSDR